MSTTATQPSLSDENITVERKLDDAIELRIQHGPDQCTGTLNKSDVIALAKTLDVNAEDLNVNEEDEYLDEIRFFGVGVTCCLVFGGLIGFFSN